MKNAGFLALILAVVATAWLRFGAMAEHRPPGPPPGPPDPPARIRSLQGDLMELELPGGWRKSVKLDDRTQVRKGRERGSRSELKVGQFVVVFDVGGRDQTPEAVMVDLLPPPRRR